MDHQELVHQRSALGRRQIIAAAAVCPILLTGLATAQESGATGDKPEGFAALISSISGNPYVAAAGVVFEVVSGAITANWQSQVSSELGKIRQQLAVIERKIDVLLANVLRLPQVIERKLAEQRKTEILVALKAERKIFMGVLASYEEETGPLVLSELHRNTILDATTSTLKLAFELQH